MELSRLLSARVLLYDLHTRKGKPPGNPLRSTRPQNLPLCAKRCNKNAHESRSAGNPVRKLVGAIDASMVLFGKSPEKPTTVLLQPFVSRFVLGILAANVTFPAQPAVGGAIVGLLISVPEAIAMKSYAGSLGTGLVFGALTGLAVRLWVT